MACVESVVKMDNLGHLAHLVKEDKMVFPVEMERQVLMESLVYLETMGIQVQQDRMVSQEILVWMANQAPMGHLVIQDCLVNLDKMDFLVNLEDLELKEEQVREVIAEALETLVEMGNKD